MSLFVYRGVLAGVDNIVPATLSTSLAYTDNTLVWNIGGRFPTKALELSLQATVVFKQTGVDIDDKAFYVGSNAYIEVCM